MAEEEKNLEVEEGNEQPKTFTQEEVDALLQREGDKRVTDALKKAERKREEAVKEAEKLARMSEEERFLHELSQKETMLNEKEKQLALSENKASASSILAEKGLSTKLVDFILAPDAETMLSNINTLDELFRLSVKEEVEKRLKSSTPSKNLPTGKEITKESFKKMSLSQQGELYANNPELYKTLTQ